MLFGREWQFGKAGLKTSSPNHYHVLFKLFLKNYVIASWTRIPGKEAGMPGEQASIREERFTFPLTIACFRGIRTSRNGSRNAER